MHSDHDESSSQAAELYLDHAASAGALGGAARARLKELIDGELLGERLGNPSSAHAEGRRARKVLRMAREELAAALGARPEEVVFTSGVSEALHLAAHGLATPGALPAVTSAFEHRALFSVLESATGAPALRLPLDAHGAPIADACLLSAGAPPALLAFAAVNNELGWQLPKEPVVRLARALAAPLLIDAAQALYVAPDFWAAPEVTALALSSHKIGGPAGSGALLVRSGRPFVSVMRGGPQEHELRAGTEAVMAAAAFARQAATLLNARALHLRQLGRVRDAFEAGVLRVPGARIVGIVGAGSVGAGSAGAGPAVGRPRAPSISAVAILGVSARALLEALATEGITVSSGAACAAHAGAPSSVLSALGLSRERALEVIRVSFSPDTSQEDAVRAAAAIGRAARRLRGEAPTEPSSDTPAERAP